MPIIVDTDRITLNDNTVFNSTAQFGMRNRLINGACQVAQRGSTTFNSQGTFTYGAVDRFVNAVSGASSWSATILQSDIGNGRRAQRIQFTSTGTAVLQMGQRVESINTYDMVGGQATFSGMLFHDFGSSQSFTVRVFYPSATNTFGNGLETVIQQTNITLQTGVETPFSMTFTVPSEGARGLMVEVMANITAKTAKSVLLWNWQLERGSVATPFEHRPFGAELALCQRYYQINVAAFAANVTSGIGYGAWVSFPVAMRANPTSAFSSSLTATSFPATAGTFQYSRADGFLYEKTANATSGGRFADVITAAIEL